MGLPISTKEINHIKTKLPSGKSIGVRGWKVKDEKDLLFVLDSEANEEEENKIKCLLEFLSKCTDNLESFNKLSESDIKKIAIEVRKLSKGDTIEYSYKCPHCKNKFSDEVSLTKCVTVKPFDLAPAIINENLTIIFKENSFDKMEEIRRDYGSNASKFDFYTVLNAIEGVTDNNETYTNFTIQELETYVDGFESNDMKTIYREYADKKSKVILERKIKCMNPSCLKEVTINYGNLLSFLVL